MARKPARQEPPPEPAMRAPTAGNDAGIPTPNPASPAAGPPPVVTVEPSRCPECGATDREDYNNTVTREIPGVLPDGRPYCRVTWRRTRCLACGQHRIDKTYE